MNRGFILKLSLLSLILCAVGPSLKAADNSDRIPYTLQTYKKASRQTIEATATAAAFAVGRQDDSRHPIFLPGAPEVISRLADTVLEQSPVGTICALGQSPAYIVFAARIKEEIKGPSEPRFKHITFSGKWFRRTGNVFEKNCKYPKGEGLKLYLSYLQRTGLAPRDIVESYKATGFKTTITEYTLSGESLYSFLELLYDWATEEQVADNLKEALEVCMFQSNISEAHYNVDNTEADFFGFKVVKHLLNQTDNIIMSQFSESDVTGDRLTYYHPYTKWVKWQENLNEELVVSENAKYVMFKIIQYLIELPDNYS